MKWKTLGKFLPVIGIGIFVYLVIKLDFVRILDEIKSLNPVLFIIVIILSGLFLIIQPLKWFILAKKQSMSISFKDAFKINLISNFYGFVTPGKIGSIMRINYLKKKGVNTGKGISNFVIDKVLDMCSLFVFAVILGFVFYKEILPSNYLFLLIFLFAIIIVSFLIFYKKENSRRILRFVYNKFIPKKFKEKSKFLFDSFYEDFPPGHFLLLVFVINLLVWTFDYFIIYVIGIGLGIKISFIYFIIILSISTLVAQIPITINGFGTRELTLIGLFSLFSIEAVKVFSMSVLSILIMGVIPSIIAIILILLSKNEIYHTQKS